MSEAQFWVHDFYSITMFILGGISIFQDAYGTLIFVKSRLRCQDCGGYVLHAKEELDAHLKVRAFAHGWPLISLDHFIKYCRNVTPHDPQ